jgi:hypothetical protein
MRGRVPTGGRLASCCGCALALFSSDVPEWCSGGARTPAASVPFQVRVCGIFSGQNGTETGFLLVLRFPLPILVQPSVIVLVYHPAQ